MSSTFLYTNIISRGRVELKKFYSLNQSALLHLYKKRPKKILLPNDLELSNMARNPIKKISPAKNFSGLKAMLILILKPKWPFYDGDRFLPIKRQLLLEYSPYIFF